MEFYITGDTHGEFSRMKNFPGTHDDAIIILGDVGINYFLTNQDSLRKKYLMEMYPYHYYCLRGNHEARPQDVDGMHLIYDKNVNGDVWVEDEFPNIKYFKDFGEYEINGYKVLAIGGAYSVDKQIRLIQHAQWFENEQLSRQEMKDCMQMCNGKKYDFVFTHTCPLSVQPTDLFLSCFDQSIVDTSMEVWLDEVKYNTEWYIWLFGHYHEDRLERPHVEMFMFEIENINDIYNRWKQYDDKGKLDWWLPKSPNFFFDDKWPISKLRND